MTAKHYEWNWGGQLPILLRHSEVKHSLLRDYLVEYFVTLVRAPGQERVQLTIVDGFCGGGRYVNEFGVRVPGSPIVILNSVKEASARVHHEQQRRKHIEFDVQLICVDEDLSAISHLQHVLEEEGYKEQLRTGKIKLLNGNFVSHSSAIIAEVKRRSPKAGRAIFVLDQYGYDAVPLQTLQSIFSTLSRPEVILTFNVDSLMTFINSKNLQDFERKTGISGAVPATELDKTKRSPRWRLQLQANLYQKITAGSGAKFFTPFFIRPEKGHGDFWLLHLSQHWKARDVMTTAHWEHHNHFVHYGGAGFDMLSTGYAARVDDQNRLQSAFEFDDLASKNSQSDMLRQIPEMLASIRGGMSFGDFFLNRINSTPATETMVKKAVLELARDKEIQIVGADGAARNVRTTIQREHILRLPAQKSFSFASVAKNKT